MSVQARGPMQGDIWLVALDPTVGREIRKTRPALIISPDEMNASLRTLTIAPMTTGSRLAPFRVPIMFEGKSGLVLLDQMRTVDRQRLSRRLGAAEPETCCAVLMVLQEMFTT